MIWIFLFGLALVLVAMAVVAARTRRPIIPVDVDESWASVGVFYRRRPAMGGEVDLGRDWRSETDPGAAFTLSWISETRELVVLRSPAEPVMTSYGLGLFAPTPGLARSAKRKTGLKALARLDLDEVRALPLEELRSSMDGLDRLTAALGCPYFPPDPTRTGPSASSNG